MIKNLFEPFCNNIEIEQSIVNKISDVKNTITDCICKYYDNPITTKNSLYIGSYGRNTAAFTEHIRLLCVLPSNLYLKINLDVKEILKDLTTALRKSFMSCDKSDIDSGLCIRINSELSFEIIPGFSFDNEEYLYLKNNSWQELHLGLEKKMFNTLNLENKNNVLNLCRILKIWKTKKELDISNILLDTFVFHFFNLSPKQKFTFDSYDEMILQFFKFLLPNSKKNHYISFDSKTILERQVEIYSSVFESMTIAETAVHSARKGRYDEAFNDWKKIFGSFFFTTIS